ncbi:hypothetical protein Moror_16875 [Moniliophthora roreri MCA 2997]|uniref:F-box domain-containing protein n=1 Tax=Moniliophthora roreri (strain MCA 2997) TaxID=1381753 RepID=V2YDG9_MONRO|nr:hypothetical protein Moror_16875 [Moniliophthora roreri MCA 2997]
MALVPTSQQCIWSSFSRKAPPELQDRILDFGHKDKEFLFSCSLVCKSWVPTTRLHIFSKRVRPYQGSTKNQIVTLCKLLESEHCTIVSYIKHLRVTKNDCYYSYRVDDWFLTFCQTLGAQAGLRLESLDLDVDLADLRQPNLKESLSSLKALNLSVRIGRVEKGDISQKIKEIFEFLSGMRLLESLGLKVTGDYYSYGATLDDVQVPQPEDVASIPRLSFPRLRKLTLRSSICNAFLPWLIEPGLVYFPALSFVHLGHCDHEVTVNSAVLQNFLDTICGKTVQDLVLCVAWENLSALDLHGIHALRSIDLHGIGYRAGARAIANAVSTISPEVKERGVTVYTHMMAFNPPEIVGVDWRDMSWRCED